MNLAFDLDGDSNTSVLACVSHNDDGPPFARELMLDRMSRAFGSPIIWHDVPEIEAWTLYESPTYWAQVRVSLPEHAADLKRLRMLDGPLMQLAYGLRMEEEGDFYRRNREVVWASERWSKALRIASQEAAGDISRRIIASMQTRINACP